MKENLSAARSLQKIDTAHQSGLSGSGKTNDSLYLSFLNIQTDIVQGGKISGGGVKYLSESLYGDDALPFRLFLSFLFPLQTFPSTFFPLQISPSTLFLLYLFFVSLIFHLKLRVLTRFYTGCGFLSKITERKLRTLYY